MNTINYSVHRMQSESPAIPAEEFPMAPVEMPAPPVPMAPEPAPEPVPEVPKPTEAPMPLALKKQYYGFSRPTGFSGTEGAGEAGMSTTQKIGLAALGAIVLGSIFRS